MTSPCPQEPDEPQEITASGGLRLPSLSRPQPVKPESDETEEQ